MLKCNIVSTSITRKLTDVSFAQFVVLMIKQHVRNRQSTKNNHLFFLLFFTAPLLFRFKSTDDWRSPARRVLQTWRLSCC